MRGLGLAAGLSIAVLGLAAVPGLAQGTQGAQGATVPFGGLKLNSSQPVEITSDALALDQGAGTAVFTGTVKVAQGTLRMASDRLEVVYAGTVGSKTGAVQRMLASGNVTLSNGTEAAESKTATYEVASGIVVMEGEVLLTQGQNALSGQTLHIDLNAGTAQMEGRVQTIFTPQAKPGAASPAPAAKPAAKP